MNEKVNEIKNKLAQSPKFDPQAVTPGTTNATLTAEIKPAKKKSPADIRVKVRGVHFFGMQLVR